MSNIKKDPYFVKICQEITEVTALIDQIYYDVEEKEQCLQPWAIGESLRGNLIRSFADHKTGNLTTVSIPFHRKIQQVSDREFAMYKCSSFGKRSITQFCKENSKALFCSPNCVP